LLLQALSAGLALLVSFQFDQLSAEQAATIVAVLSAVIGVVNAIAVRPVAPAAFTGLAGAVFALLAAYGFNVGQETVGAVQAFVVTVLALVTRLQVTPVADPRPADQVVG
jgi:membrane associated rhomboid family serine protease